MIRVGADAQNVTKKIIELANQVVKFAFLTGFNSWGL
jgi:hypothetical protein